MFNEDVFNFDINNIKNDLAIEGVWLFRDEDVTLFKQFANEEIDIAKLNSNYKE